MKKLYSNLLIVALTLCTSVAFSQNDLVFTGLISGSNSGLPKALEIYVVNDVADLSAYGIANANNGNPSGGIPKFNFPAESSATAGSYIYISKENDEFEAYFGFAPDYIEDPSLAINGDDAMELYHDGIVVDYMGEVGVDGTDEPWEYSKGWMYRVDGTGANTNFTLSDWVFSGINATVTTTNADADNPMPIGTYSTEGGGGEPSIPLTISEIQETTDPSGDSPYVNQTVITSGIVTAVSDNGYWIQDGEGAWTGIFVRTSDEPTVAIGDQIHIEATVQENYGLTRLNNIVDFETISSENTLPTPTLVTTGNAGVEEYESVLISISGATCVDNDLGFGEWAINDGSGQYRVAPEMYDAEPANFTTYDVTGIAHYSFDIYKVLPRYADDVVEIENVVGLSFEVSELMVNETDGTVTVYVGITNPISTPTSVEVAVTGGTAVLGTHYEYTDPTTLTFEADATESQSFTFDLIDDDEANEDRTIIFELQNATSGAMFGNGVLEVTIGDDDTVIEITDIAVAAAVDAEGIAINLGEEYTVTGIVHGVNMNGNGLSITLIDGTGGVGLYSPTPVAYEVAEGDSIVVTGTVDQYNGLTQLSYLSPIEFISSEHDLMDPIVVTELTENHESQLVMVECVYLEDASQWTTGSGNGGFSVTVTNGTDSYTVRINNDVELYNAEAPTGTFNLTGLVGQFVFDPPYLTGYQVIPRYAADIEPADCGVILPPANNNCSGAISLNSLMGGDFDVPQLSETFTNVDATSDEDPGNGWECFGEPDGTGSAPSLESTVWFSFTGDGNTYLIQTNNCNDTAEDYIPMGDTQMAVYTGVCGFSTPLLCNEDGPNATGNNYPAGAELSTEEGETYLMMIDGYDGAQGEFCVEFTMLEPDGVNDINNFSFDVYPNPATDRLFVETPIAVQAATLINVLGQEVKAYGFNASQNVEINVNGLDAGIYILQLRSVDNQISTTKVVVE